LSTPTLNHIRAAHERFWNWIFSVKDGVDHPLNKSGGGEAQERFDNMLIVAGSLQGGGRKDRSLKIPKDIKYIFVPADNCMDTVADAATDGKPTDRDLIDNVDRDIRGAAEIAKVSINDSPQGVDLLPPHLFSVNIQEAIEGTGRSRKGEGLRGGGQLKISTMGAAACYYAIIPADKLQPGDTIKITGRRIEVTYTVR